MLFSELYSKMILVLDLLSSFALDVMDWLWTEIPALNSSPIEIILTGTALTLVGVLLLRLIG